MNSKAREIIDLCEEKWKTTNTECSSFIKAVASSLGVILQGNANSILDHLEQAKDWHKLEGDRIKASQFAGMGFLVVAGQKKDSHGVVVIVVSSEIQGAYPLGYWASFHTVGRKNTPINFCWRHADFAKVKYYAKRV